MQDATAVPVTVVANATNRGFPAAINQGLQLAQGEYLVLLNNDVVVTDGWLDQLIALVNAKNHLTAETAETKTESEDGNLTIIDFNEARGEIESSSMQGPLPSPLALRPPPFARGGEFIRACCFARRKDAAWTGSGRFNDRPGRADVQLCRAAAVGRGGAVSRPGRDARISPGGGATSTAGSGSPCPSCRGSACS